VIVLAIDTSTPAVTTGLVDLDGMHTQLARVTVNARAHGELLAPHVRDVLAEAGLTADRVDAIVCGAGPGPFTGLRVGMVTASALGHALDLPVYPVCSLDAIAADTEGSEPLLVVTDARRREVYWAAYDGAHRRVDGPHVQRPAELAELTDLPERVVGAGAELLGRPVNGPAYPSPMGLVAVAADDLRAKTEPAPLTPLYLRRPDAVPPGTAKKVTV
jgi:tRNA threonylcarbamoyl adenosine modification protein YeaZ